MDGDDQERRAERRQRLEADASSGALASRTPLQPLALTAPLERDVGERAQVGELAASGRPGGRGPGGRPRLIGSAGRRGRARRRRAPATTRRKTLLRGLRALTLDPALAVPEVVELLLDAVGGRVELQGLLPRGERVLVQAVLDEASPRCSKMTGSGSLALSTARLSSRQRFRIAPLLVVRPAETVDEVAVLGLEVERLA